MSSSDRKIAAAQTVVLLHESAADLDGQPEYHRVALAFKALSGDNSSLSLLNREYQRILKTLAEMQNAGLEEPHNVKLQIEPNPESEHSAADSAHPHSDF